jgi:hypothetical protein
MDGYSSTDHNSQKVRLGKTLWKSLLGGYLDNHRDRDIDTHIYDTDSMYVAIIGHKSNTSPLQRAPCGVLCFDMMLTV